MSALFSSDRDVMSGVGLARIAAASCILLIAAPLGGCSAPALPLAGASPADASAPVPRVGYRSTTSGYRSLRPVDPAPWIEQNERVAPSGSKQ